MTEQVQLYTLTLRRSVPIMKDGVESGTIRDMIETHEGISWDGGQVLIKKAAAGIEDIMWEKLRMGVQGKVKSTTAIGEVTLGKRTTPKAVLPGAPATPPPRRMPARKAPAPPARPVSEKLGGGDLADLVNAMVEEEA